MTFCPDASRMLSKLGSGRMATLMKIMLYNDVNDNCTARCFYYLSEQQRVGSYFAVRVPADVALGLLPQRRAALLRATRHQAQIHRRGKLIEY